MTLIDSLKGLDTANVNRAVESIFGRLTNDGATEAATNVLLRDYLALTQVAIGVHQAAIDRGRKPEEASLLSQGAILALLVVKECAELEVIDEAER